MTASTIPGLACADHIEVVTDYLEHDLGAVERERFDAHLLACPGCVESVAQIRRTVAALRALAVEALDPHVLSELPRRA